MGILFKPHRPFLQDRLIQGIEALMVLLALTDPALVTQHRQVSGKRGQRDPPPPGNTELPVPSDFLPGPPPQAPNRTRPAVELRQHRPPL